MINWNSESFHPVVNLPDKYKILDLTQGSWNSGTNEFSIGKYDDKRIKVKVINTEEKLKYNVYLIADGRLYTDRIHDAAVMLDNRIIEGPPLQFRQ